MDDMLGSDRIQKVDDFRGVVLGTGGFTITVVITTHNHAHFLGDAITSILEQRRTADEVIVVDDGSTDNPAAVVARFPGVRLIRQRKLGLSTARNTGLRNCATSHVTFLDADDRLLPEALERGAAFASMRPDCAFIYGAHRWITADGRPNQDFRYCFKSVGDQPHLSFLRDNPIGMHATVLYRRDLLIAEGGFDEMLHLCEDYDLFLRIVHKHPIACHPAVIAEYRQHANNISNNSADMLRAVLEVLDRHEIRIDANVHQQEALRAGREHFRRHYTRKMLEAALANHSSLESAKLIISAVDGSPITVTRTALKFLSNRIADRLPRVLRRIRPNRFPLGSVRFGDLDRLSPISSVFGFDRGTPIDRYYIEHFLNINSRDIRGHVLEAGDDAYTVRFGGTQVKRSDILHLDASNPRATIIGNLADEKTLPEARFDCVVLTQTLHYLFDMRCGVAALARALKVGGTLLLTVPGISGIDGGEWGSAEAWSATAPAVRRLLQERFDPDAVTVKAYGNVFAATAFLHGLVVEELDQSALDAPDPRYPIVVVARAVKA